MWEGGRGENRAGGGGRVGERGENTVGWERRG